MPIKKTVPAKKQKQPTKPISKPKRLPMWLLPTVAIGIILVAVLGVYIALTGGGVSEQAKMEAYLKDKYGEEFLVEDVTYKNSGLGVQGIWEGLARPRDDTSLKFRVGASERNFSDQYIAALWSKEATPEFEKYVSSVYPQDDINASMQIILSDSLLRSATKNTPSLKEAQAMENGFLYKVVIVRKHGNEKNIGAEALLASRLLDLIAQSGVKKSTLDYTLETETGTVKHCEIFSGDSKLDAPTIENCIRNERI